MILIYSNICTYKNIGKDMASNHWNPMSKPENNFFI